MKLNWGTSIAIFYLLFMIVMISMVVKASNNRVELVQENYYKKDLNYESFRKSRQNAERLEKRIEIEVASKENAIMISFPVETESVTGEVTLYRPSNDRMDKKVVLNLDHKNKMAIPANRLAQGLWRVQIRWNNGVDSFYQEQSIYL